MFRKEIMCLLSQVTQNSVKEYMMEVVEDMEMDNKVVVEKLLDLATLIILEVEYISNHLSDLPQIINLFSGDQS